MYNAHTCKHECVCVVCVHALRTDVGCQRSFLREDRQRVGDCALNVSCAGPGARPSEPGVARGLSFARLHASSLPEVDSSLCSQSSLHVSVLSLKYTLRSVHSSPLQPGGGLGTRIWLVPSPFTPISSLNRVVECLHGPFPAVTSFSLCAIA